jgi:hypothetical protein
MLYGKKEFTLDPVYIQSNDDANDLMAWLTQKILKPRKNIGVKIFSNPTIQLGDIVNISYKNEINQDMVSPLTSKFVVYHIDYNKDSTGPEMALYLSEV